MDTRKRKEKKGDEKKMAVVLQAAFCLCLSLSLTLLSHVPGIISAKVANEG